MKLTKRNGIKGIVTNVIKNPLTYLAIGGILSGCDKPREHTIEYYEGTKIIKRVVYNENKDGMPELEVKFYMDGTPYQKEAWFVRYIDGERLHLFETYFPTGNVENRVIRDSNKHIRLEEHFNLSGNLICRDIDEDGDGYREIDERYYSGGIIKGRGIDIDSDGKPELVEDFYPDSSPKYKMVDRNSDGKPEIEKKF